MSNITSRVGYYSDFSPTIKFGGTGAAATITRGRYTRVGNLVNVCLNFTVTNFNGGSGVMSFGLPFAAASTNIQKVPGGLWDSSGDSHNLYNLLVNIGYSATEPAVLTDRGAAGAISTTYANISTSIFNTTDIIYLNFSYECV
jgi:hypothetical protein